MRRLATFIAPYWAHLASGLISLILLTGTQLFIPRYAGVTVDEIIRTGSMAVVNRAALVALAVLGLRSLLLYGQLYFGLLDRKSTRLNSSHTVISYAVFCLKKKK